MRLLGQQRVCGGRKIWLPRFGQQTLALQQPRQRHASKSHRVLREEMAAAGKMREGIFHKLYSRIKIPENFALRNSELQLLWGFIHINSVEKRIDREFGKDAPTYGRENLGYSFIIKSGSSRLNCAGI